MKSIQDSKKILICLPANINLDTYISAHIIAQALKQDMNKEVDICSTKELPVKFVQNLTFGEIKQLTKLPPRKFVLEFKNQPNKIKNIQWNQEGDKLNFFVTMENGKLNVQDFTSKMTGGNYETIILIGVNSVNELAENYIQNQDLFTEANVIQVGGQKQVEVKDTTQVTENKHTSVSEDAYLFMQKNSLKIDKDRATELLAGIFSATNNFKKNLASPETFVIAAELVRRGATNEGAQSILDKTKEERPYQLQPQAQSNPNQSQRSTQGAPSSQMANPYSREAQRENVNQASNTQNSQNQKS